jgi:RNA polymerase sigma factor (sigma-70 family)
MTSFRGWLRVLCRNLVADGAREARPLAGPVLAETCVEAGEELGIREALQACIDRLREPDRTVFKLRYDSGWTTAGIAELFGWKQRNCELVLARARESLSRCLRQAGCGLQTGSRERRP